MRKNFGAKPLSYPQAVYMVCTYNEDGTENVMNAAWGGVTNDKEFTLCIDRTHKTAENLVKGDSFTVSMGDERHVVECDYVGVVSGNKEPEKTKKSGFTFTKSEFVNAPVINELAVCIECKIKSFSLDSEVLVGEIVNVSVCEDALTDDKVDVRKVAPIVFDPFNHSYYALGEKVGDAFKDGLKIK